MKDYLHQPFHPLIIIIVVVVVVVVVVGMTQVYRSFWIL